ncbi:MAG: hypothetical protein UT34_C0001G0220 [candidate division WS6 bacterium GW2011_GWF2_39_15]|uniref:Uncharacterized protein n=1 Tax=candidate division WS6 bacterium GW2011_GWF2_39_15 TaxID=1619100 RepID=A0A0G0Q6Y8_9BACT|nr:MAG: hypothetical protein UT34_C0001G0220 [candidate division WS6 bacterium GW2011_GWF2_39_15]
MKESTKKRIKNFLNIFVAIILIGSIVFPLIITILGL